MEKTLWQAVAKTYIFAWKHKKNFYTLFQEWILGGLGICIGVLLIAAVVLQSTALLTDYKHLPLPLLSILILTVLSLLVLMSGFVIVGIVRCHRLYILGELDAKWQWGWSGNAWFYAKRVFASSFWIMLWCIPFFAILMPLLLLPLILAVSGGSEESPSIFLTLITVFPLQIATLYLFSRYCLSLVGGALGEYIPLKESVRLTAPLRWRITWHSVLLISPLYLLGEILHATGWDIVSFVLSIILSVISAGLGAFVYSSYYVKLKFNKENIN